MPETISLLGYGVAPGSESSPRLLISPNGSRAMAYLTKTTALCAIVYGRFATAVGISIEPFSFTTGYGSPQSIIVGALVPPEWLALAPEHDGIDVVNPEMLLEHSTLHMVAQDFLWNPMGSIFRDESGMIHVFTGGSAFRNLDLLPILAGGVPTLRGQNHDVVYQNLRDYVPTEGHAEMQLQLTLLRRIALLDDAALHTIADLSDAPNLTPSVRLAAEGYFMGRLVHARRMSGTLADAIADDNCG